MKSVQIGLYFSVLSPNTGKHRPEKTPYLDTFHPLKRAEQKYFEVIERDYILCFPGNILISFVLNLNLLGGILITVHSETTPTTSLKNFWALLC